MNQANDHYVPMNELQHHCVYRLRSRNLEFGVWDVEKMDFTGVRQKFDELYLSKESHYDVGPPYGTAKPYEYIDDFTDCDPITWITLLLKIELLECRKQLRSAQDKEIEDV